MKIYIVFILIPTFCLFYGCKEEHIGQYPVDDIPPAPVKNIRVETYPGTVILYYDLPEEDDLLSINARFTLPNGIYQEMSRSAYTNTMELKGFGKSKKTLIELVSIDKSFNESEPVYVEVEPENSPMYDTLESLIIYEAFGGLKFHWENPYKENLVFNLLIKNEEGEYRHVDAIYSSEAIAERSIRGLDAGPTDFAFFFRDTYNNYTDTIFDTLAPLYEVQLDKSLFTGMRLSGKFTLHSYGSSNMNVLWNDIYTTNNNIYYINVSAEKIYFNFDMGVEAKLSRFKLWTRPDFIYQLHHFRNFEVWGTSDPAATTDPDNWDGWFKVGEFESIRPSGDEGTPVSNEDLEYARAGEEFDVPIEAPAFRYFRFYITRTWSDSQAAFLNEITIWGNDQF